MGGMKAGKRSYWIAVLAFLGLTGILAAYYLYHKPFDFSFVLALFNWVWAVTVAIGIASISGGLGRILLRGESQPGILRGFVQFTLGLGIHSLIILGIGVWLPYLRIILWAYTVIAIVLLNKPIRKWIQEIWSDLAARAFWSSEPRFLWVLICLGLSFSFLTASAPPIQFDALTYHLSLPQAYLQHNQIITPVDSIRTGMPQTGEMIFTWAMSLAGGSAGALVGWIAGVLALFALNTYIRQTISPKTGWISLAILLAGGSVSASLGWAYIDWFCFVFGLAAWIQWDQYRKSSNPLDLLYAGVFCGFAFASKYTGGIILLGLVSIAMFRLRTRFLSGGILIAGFILPAIPWLVKNMVTTGNPVAPFTFSPGESPIIQNLSAFGNIWDILILPVRATVLGTEGGVGYSHDIGPFLLILGAIFWLLKNEENRVPVVVTDAAIAAVTALVIWVVGNQVNGLLIQSRMYYAVFPVYTILAVAGVEGLSRVEIPQVRVRRVLQLVITIVLGFGLIQAGRNQIRQGSLSYLFGIIPDHQYLDENLGWYAPAMREIRGSGKATLLLYEPRGYYCEPNCFADEDLGRWSRDLRLFGNCPAILGDWKSKGYEQVLVNTSGIEFFLRENDPNHTRGDLTSLNECLGNLPEIARFGEIYRLLDLN